MYGRKTRSENGLHDCTSNYPVSEETHADATRTVLRNQCAEDPRLAPFEKQTALHLDGDSTHIEVTSFRKVVFAKLLQRPAFEVKRLSVLDENGKEHTVESLDKVASEPSLTVIRVTGLVPVGALSIGTPRNSNSHADIVTQI